MPLQDIERTAVECGAVIERSRLQQSEVPIVLGYLLIALSDHTSLPVETIIDMTSHAALSIKSKRTETTAGN